MHLVMTILAVAKNSVSCSTDWWHVNLFFIRHYSQQNTTQIKEKKGQTDRYIYTVKWC